MIKLVNERALELERIEAANKKWEEIFTTPERVDAQTFILVRKGKCCKEAVEKFKKELEISRKNHEAHVEPFLSK